jgi:hypothetical protein
MAAALLRLSWEAGVAVGHLHGIAMAQERDFYAHVGNADSKDVFVLADVARAHPRRGMWPEPTDEARPRLELLRGYEADLCADANRLTASATPSNHPADASSLVRRPSTPERRKGQKDPAQSSAEAHCSQWHVTKTAIPVSRTQNRPGSLRVGPVHRAKKSHA